MKKYKNIVLSFITVAICASMIIPFMNGSHASSVDADFTYTILDSGMFTHDITISNHTYTLNCYRIKNYDSYIGIAWGSSDAPQTISIPSTITSNKPTGSNEDYTVVAVARAGFSHCTSTTITLPQTIVDIREEAFAYCQNLSSFIIPKDVTQIAPSTFLDCRKLATLYYSNEDGKKTLSNSTITSFGDHAFDSCISLKKVQCPVSATFFGQSCFQKCTTLSVFRFPLSSGDNAITVEDYAFADCTSLQRVYFDVNMQNVSDYAFADSKEDLTFYFYDTQANFPTSLSAKWRNKKITFGSDNLHDYSSLVYDINYNIDKPLDGGYPGLTVSLSNAERKLDNARTNNTSVVVIPGGGSQYAIITRFETPDEDDWMDGYYSDGILTIPDRVLVDNVYYPVKVIESQAFGNNDDIREVYFNSNLVQICNKAFWHSNNVESLHFEDCLSLVEISYSIFNDIIANAGKENDAIIGEINKSATVADSNQNKKMHGITLPNCLQYLGNFAFFNFTRLTDCLSFKTNPSNPSNLKIIGDYAFAVYSESSGAYSNNDYYKNAGLTATIDVELPYSLDDAAAPLANIYHSFSFDRKGGTKNTTYPTVNASIWNRVAINKNVFDNQDSIRSVKMESGGTPHNISFGSNIFVRNNGIIRFEASDNLCLLGNEFLKTCPNLREVFFTSDRSKANTHYCNSTGVLTGATIDNPWGVGDGTNDLAQTRFLFNTDDYYDLVIYVKGNGSGNYPNTGNNNWHNISTNNAADTAYRASDFDNGKRANIPVYFVDWTTQGNIKYWHLNDASGDILAHDTLLDFENGPRTLEDYCNGYISFCKGSNNKYTAVRYYTNGTAGNYAKTVDLTSSTLSSMTIDVIGHEAFGGKNNKGDYIILPNNTITKIEERAFYRYDKSYGVKIVTFKNNNATQTPSGNSHTYAQIINSIETQNGSGYCCLPNSITRLERAAFYNNYFGSVELGTKLTFIGNIAFYSNQEISRNQSFLFTDYSDNTQTDTNSAFTSYNNGVYHTSNKMLLHQANGLTGDMTLRSGTKYIGYRAAAGSHYTSVTFDNATQYIYGHAFRNCLNLTSLNNVSSLVCIGTSDGYPSASNYDKDDGSNTSNDTGAFENCSSLKVDFSQMTSLKKIGSSAFKKCTNIVTDLSLTRTYSYKTYTHSTGTTTSATTITNVMDLSTLTGLTNVNANAFDSCSINYVITPNTTGSNYNTESKITFGSNAFVSTNARILCGETAQQADQSGNTANKPTTHYPNNALRPSASNYTNLYYRVHSTADLVAANTERRYWTAIDTGNNNEISIIIFESKADAEGWLNNATNVASQRHSLA